MLRRMPTLAALTVAFLFGLATHGFAQDDSFPVTLVMRDGTPVPFTLNANRGLPMAVYSDVSENFSWGQFIANVGGTSTRIPFTQIARVDLVAPGQQTVWRATLKDGRVFDGAVGASSELRISGTNQFGAAESLRSFARNRERQPFIGILFDPDAVAAGEATAQPPVAHADVDSVTLRNGDVLSGSILTGEFTVQASYGTLTFTSEQLASINIEDTAGRTDQFVLKVGDRVSGVLQNVTIEMTLSTGATIALEKGNIASITFARED